MNLPELGISLSEKGVENYLAFAIPNIPEIQKDDDLGKIIYDNSQLIGGFVNRDIIIIASKIVSKSEDKIIDVSDIEITPAAIELAQAINKPPQVCQIILDESIEQIVRNGKVITLHNLGYSLTSAGVDRISDSVVSLIPNNPDLSSRRIRERIEQLSGQEVTVIVSDSEGRRDRAGAGAIALGISGMNPLRVTESLVDGTVKRSEETLSDLLVSGASVIIGQRGKQVPAVCIRGIKYERDLSTGVLDILHSKL